MHGVHKTTVRNHYTAAGSEGKKTGVFPRRDKIAARFELNLLFGGGRGGSGRYREKNEKNQAHPCAGKKRESFKPIRQIRKIRCRD